MSEQIELGTEGDAERTGDMNELFEKSRILRVFVPAVFGMPGIAERSPRLQYDAVVFVCGGEADCTLDFPRRRFRKEAQMQTAELQRGRILNPDRREKPAADPVRAPAVFRQLTHGLKRIQNALTAGGTDDDFAFRNVEPVFFRAGHGNVERFRFDPRRRFPEKPRQFVQGCPGFHLLRSGFQHETAFVLYRKKSHGDQFKLSGGRKKPTGEELFFCFVDCGRHGVILCVSVFYFLSCMPLI